MKRKLSPGALYGIVVGGLLVYALFGWFAFVGPKRAEAAQLKLEVAAAEVAVTTARAAAEVKPGAEQIAVADIFRLAKAMPAIADMPGILLELSRIAGETGIEFRSISPQPSKPVGDYQSVPITLVFDGSFYELSDFLFRLRTLVGVRRGELQATGRLFAVNSIAFAESVQGFPEITATLTVNAFVYGSTEPASSVPAAAAPTDTGAAGTTPPPAGEAPAPEEAP
jgi:Pilus assembly protein, PilO